MTDKITQQIIKKAMPTARIIERAAGGIDTTLVLKVDAVTPDTDALIRKYAECGLVRSRGKRVSVDKVADKFAVAGDSDDDDDIEATEVSVGEDLDAPMRLSRRTVIVDKKKKRIIGMTG